MINSAEIKTKTPKDRISKIMMGKPKLKKEPL